MFRKPLRKEDEVTGKIIGSGIEVHKQLGPGLLKSAYQVCLAREMELLGIQFVREKPLPIIYKGVNVIRLKQGGIKRVANKL
jgi:GxxExxY protein